MLEPKPGEDGTIQCTECNSTFQRQFLLFKRYWQSFHWEMQEIGYMWVILAPTFMAQENKEGGLCLTKALG